MRPRVLILGGTTEARELGEALAVREVTATMSLAGRTSAPAAQAVGVRRGGFGGVEGLADYLRTERIDFLIDATHPYAETMSANAVGAAARTGTRLLALRRPAWTAVEGDTWIDVSDVEDAVRSLGQESRRVFLAIGRQEVAPFAAAPQHHYVIRSVDPIDPPLNVPYARYIIGRGPFAESEDRAVFASLAIDAVVAKNSGGAATYGKIAAARALAIPVFMIKRPHVPECLSVATVAEAIAWLDHAIRFPRGV